MGYPQYPVPGIPMQGNDPYWRSDMPMQPHMGEPNWGYNNNQGIYNNNAGNNRG